MKIEVKDYHDVRAIEEYWRGAYSMTNENNMRIYLGEMKKWWRLRKHLEELAGVKEDM